MVIQRFDTRGLVLLEEVIYILVSIHLIILLELRDAVRDVDCGINSILVTAVEAVIQGVVIGIYTILDAGVNDVGLALELGVVVNLRLGEETLQRRAVLVDGNVHRITALILAINSLLHDIVIEGGMIIVVGGSQELVNHHDLDGIITDFDLEAEQIVGIVILANHLDPTVITLAGNGFGLVNSLAGSLAALLGVSRNGYIIIAHLTGQSDACAALARYRLSVDSQVNGAVTGSGNHIVVAIYLATDGRSCGLQFRNGKVLGGGIALGHGAILSGSGSRHGLVHVGARNGNAGTASAGNGLVTHGQGYGAVASSGDDIIVLIVGIHLTGDGGSRSLIALKDQLNDQVSIIAEVKLLPASAGRGATGTYIDGIPSIWGKRLIRNTLGVTINSNSLAIF